MRLFKDILLNEKFQSGLFAFIFFVFAVKALISGEMCGFSKSACIPITFAYHPFDWVLAQGILWSLIIFYCFVL
jgi:hypothetical protein